MEVKEEVTEISLKCIICCSSSSSENKNKYLKCQLSSSKEVLNRFCKDFLHISRLELEDNSFLVCSDCQSFLNSAMESKVKVDEVEEQVRALQINILQKLREVQLHMNLLESKLKSVEESLIKRQPNREAANYSGTSAEAATTTTWKPQVNIEVIRFRSSITSAVKELRSFRANTRKKFFHGECAVDMGPRQPLAKQEVPIRRSPEPECDFDEGDCDDDIRDQFYPENTPSECSEETTNKEIIRNDNDNNDNESMDKTPLTFKKRKKGCHKVVLNQTNLDLLTNAVEGFPVFPFKKVKFAEDCEDHSEFKKFALEFLLKQYTELNLRLKVVYVKEFQEKTSSMDHSSAEYFLSKLQLEKKIGVYFDYDATSGSVHLKGIPITIDEDSHSIRCSECPKLSNKLKWPSSTSQSKFNNLNGRTRLKQHLLEKHLYIYKCQVANCEDKTLYNFIDFPCHLKSHIGGAGGDEDEKRLISPHYYCCEVCGRPFLCRRSIKQHLWTHKNAEEKLALASAGVTVPYLSVQFQCSTCGKKCATKYDLRQHEAIHNGGQEKVLCPVCGKSVGKKYFLQHKARICSATPPAPAPAKCLICDQTFKHQGNLRKHIKSMHRGSSNEESFVCEICGKSFKYAYNMKMHKQIFHEHLNRFSCQKDCGAKFATKVKLQKHETTCRKNGAAEEK